jgi:hypothetical protein
MAPYWMHVEELVQYLEVLVLTETAHHAVADAVLVS